MALILISNIIYILNNYTVTWFRLNASEVTLVRGVLQVIIFGFSILVRNTKLGNLKDAEGINYNENISSNLDIYEARIPSQSP